VRSVMQAADGTATAVDYLVDTSGALSQVVAETSSAALGALYVRGDDLLAVMRPGETAGTWKSRFYHADGLGSIRGLTDESGAVADRYSFTAFGELLEHTGEDNNAYLFAGESLDPNSGFYYNRARWMDPAVGRFASTDPFQGRIFDPASLHKYLYASANPANFVDPTGRENLPSMLAALAINARLAVGTVLGALRIAFTAGDGGAIGRLFNQLGAVAQRVALEVITLFPRIQVATAQLVTRALDYSMRLGNRFALMECKYAIPRGAQAFGRLVSQLTEAVAELPRLAGPATQQQVVLWTYKAPETLAEIRRLYEALGPSVATRVQFVHGVEGLASWIRLYFGV
jgi:RHS repeat-associated protein